MHLRECHDWTAQACRRSATLTSDLFLSDLPITQQVHNRRAATQIHVADLSYLATELENHAKNIDTLREGIVSQIELFDKRRNRNIGIFIALYVPLAFATVSIFRLDR
jgi:hypothetical protein